MPDEVEEYVHRCDYYAAYKCYLFFIFRIGRTGRVGNTGRATSFFDQHEDGAVARPLVRILTDAGQMVPDWLGMARGRGGW